MQQQNTKKSARTVGDVLGNFTLMEIHQAA